MKQFGLFGREVIPYETLKSEWKSKKINGHNKTYRETMAHWIRNWEKDNLDEFDRFSQKYDDILNWTHINRDCLLDKLEEEEENFPKVYSGLYEMAFNCRPYQK